MGKGAGAEQNGNLNTFALLNDQKSTDPPSMLRVSVIGVKTKGRRDSQVCLSALLRNPSHYQCPSL